VIEEVRTLFVSAKRFLFKRTVLQLEGAANMGENAQELPAT